MMICFETERMIVKSDMVVQDGTLKEKESQNSPMDILRIIPTTGLESAFVFYDKADGCTKICHIGITHQRERFEVSYGTEPSFRRHGYMKEALASLVDWIFANTNEPAIFGLPNGPESEHILQKSGFNCVGLYEDNPSMKWYRIAKPSKESMSNE